MKVVSRRK